MLQQHTNHWPFKVDLLGKLIFRHASVHSCSADCTFLTGEICGREEDGFIYLVTLLLADVCGFKGCERPARCDDFAGA